MPTINYFFLLKLIFQRCWPLISPTIHEANNFVFPKELLFLLASYFNLLGYESFADIPLSQMLSFVSGLIAQLQFKAK